MANIFIIDSYVIHFFNLVLLALGSKRKIEKNETELNKLVNQLGNMKL